MTYYLDFPFGGNSIPRFPGIRGLYLDFAIRDRSDEVIDVIYRYDPAWFSGRNITLNVYIENYQLTHWGWGAKVNLYRSQDAITLHGDNGIVNMRAENQLAFLDGVGCTVTQYSSNAEIRLNGFGDGRTTVNLYGWNSSVYTSTDSNAINLGAGSRLNAIVYSNSNIVSARGQALIYFYGSKNTAYLTGTDESIFINGDSNVANLNGGRSVNADVRGVGNIINIKGQNEGANIYGSQNTVNLYGANQGVNIYGRNNIVNLNSATETVILGGLNGVANIFNNTYLSIRGDGFTKISAGSTVGSIDVSRLKCGAIYQSPESKVVIIGNGDRHIGVINTSMAFFTNTLAGIGPPALPPGANFAISATALGAQSAITLAT